MAVHDGEREGLAEQFVAGLEKLSADRASLARLKRCAGRGLGECPQVYPLFYRLLPATGRGRDWIEESCFLVATLFPLSPARPRGGDGGLGQALHALRQRNTASAAAVDRRLAVLLDCSFEELPFRLRQVITLLAGAGVSLDWRRLLLDLLRWNLPTRPVQRQWARDYFGSES